MSSLFGTIMRFHAFDVKEHFDYVAVRNSRHTLVSSDVYHLKQWVKSKLPVMRYINESYSPLTSKLYSIRPISNYPVWLAGLFGCRTVFPDIWNKILVKTKATRMITRIIPQGSEDPVIPSTQGKPYTPTLFGYGVDEGVLTDIMDELNPSTYTIPVRSSPFEHLQHVFSKETLELLLQQGHTRDAAKWFWESHIHTIPEPTRSEILETIRIDDPIPSFDELTDGDFLLPEDRLDHML